jgi:hypothetical protein
LRLFIQVIEDLKVRVVTSQDLALDEVLVLVNVPELDLKDPMVFIKQDYVVVHFLLHVLLDEMVIH